MDIADFFAAAARECKFNDPFHWAEECPSCRESATLKNIMHYQGRRLYYTGRLGGCNEMLFWHAKDKSESVLMRGANRERYGAYGNFDDLR